MRRLLYILLMVTTLAGVFGSCRHTPGEAEARLIAIDSLIAIEPDSALAQLEAINADALPTDLRAYHDLLVTQAMYKAYVPASTDTLITRAWRYYADHGPYDRRIRAMLYRGTVAEELGHPDNAMRWYKRTELESRPDDHYHRGYALMSMAYLYQFQYILTAKCIDKYKQAVKCFRNCNNNKLELTCLSNIGRNYLLVNNDSAYKYIKQSLEYATLINDSTNYYHSIESLIGYYYIDSCWTDVKRYSVKLINDGVPFENQSSLFFAIQSYLHLNQIDSASLLLQYVRFPLQSAKDSILYYRTCSLIDEKNGDFRSSKFNAELAGEIADNELISSNTVNLSVAEEYPINVIELTNDSLKKYNYGMIIIIIVGIIILVVLFVFFSHLVNKLKHQINQERKALNAAHQQLQKQYDELTCLQSTVKSNRQKEFDLRANCINAVFKNTVYSGIRGASIFKYLFELEKEERKSLISINLPSSFWQDLEDYMNLAYPGAFDRILSDGIQMRDKEKQLIMLDCIGIPNAVVSMILGYNDRSTASIRYRILDYLDCKGMSFNDVLKSKSQTL